MNDKLKGIEPGQRVRVTFEGTRVDGGHGSEIVIAMDGVNAGEMQIAACEINAPSFKIEPIEEPVSVNDEVLFGTWRGRVVAINDSEAWVRWDCGDSGVWKLTDLERIK